MSHRFSGSTSRLHVTFHDLCRIAGDLLFARDDELARRCGWSVARTRHGLGRTYRDPRIDRLALLARAQREPGPAPDVPAVARGRQRRRVHPVRCVVERSPRTPDGW
ncbi:hypothetical protein [Catenuloplanes japonicus]|uniref:hypothetical protein n=1 Tax=Catenuloplanes japonicus TaxID=33876 RepID=UPI0012F7747D|nr:hypothetical protein [Catenuloplanes japonicus]